MKFIRKNRALYERYFDSVDRTKEKREKEKSISSNERLSRIASDVLKGKLLDAFTAVLKENLGEEIVNSNIASGCLTRLFFCDDIEEIFRLHDIFNPNPLMEPFRDYALLRMNIEYNYDVDITNKKIIVNPFLNKGKELRGVCLINILPKDLEGKELQIAFTNRQEAQIFATNFTGTQTWKHTKDMTDSWSNKAIQATIDKLIEKEGPLKSYLEILKDYTVVINKIVVEEGKNKPIKISLWKNGVMFDKSEVQDVINFFNTHFEFANNGEVILKYMLKNQHKVEIITLKEG